MKKVFGVDQENYGLRSKNVSNPRKLKENVTNEVKKTKSLIDFEKFGISFSYLKNYKKRTRMESVNVLRYETKSNFSSEFDPLGLVTIFTKKDFGSFYY